MFVYVIGFGVGQQYEPDLLSGELLMSLIIPASRRHARLQGRSRPALGLRIGNIKPTIAMVRRPVILIVAIGAVYRILCSVSGWIDESERLRGHLLLEGSPYYRLCQPANHPIVREC